jgi:putative endonuclease
MIRGASQQVLLRRPATPDALQGRQGEEAAYWHLRERGFIIVERNFRAEGLRGEIDLIGWEGETLVFVEVKTRAPEAYRAPEAAVDREKQRNLSVVARAYRQQARRLSAPFRFDIVSVTAFSGGAKIEHFRDCFREASLSAANR